MTRESGGEDRSGPLSGCEILIADADPSQRKLIERFLVAAGASVTATSGSAEAVALLFGQDARDEDTDIVLLNANLPDVCDLDAVARLRDGGFNRTIIAMAWKKDAENREALIGAGYDGLIIKPINRDELILMLETYFRRSKSARESFD